MISLNDLASDRVPQNTYQEDTALEDRLALEAEEDKKLGSQYPEDNEYPLLRSSLSGRDATQVFLRTSMSICFFFLVLPPPSLLFIFTKMRRDSAEIWHIILFEHGRRSPSNQAISGMSSVNLCWQLILKTDSRIKTSFKTCIKLVPNRKYVSYCPNFSIAGFTNGKRYFCCHSLSR